MTITFEQQPPDHICKYRIIMSRYHDYLPIRQDESEELFKQMAKELGYDIKKKTMYDDRFCFSRPEQDSKYCEEHRRESESSKLECYLCGKDLTGKKELI